MKEQSHVVRPALTLASTIHPSERGFLRISTQRSSPVLAVHVPDSRTGVIHAMNCSYCRSVSTSLYAVALQHAQVNKPPPHALICVCS